MIRLLLVDDHPVVRTGYQRLLEQAGDISVVAQADRVDLAFEFADHVPATFAATVASRWRLER